MISNLLDAGFVYKPTLKTQPAPLPKFSGLPVHEIDPLQYDSFLSLGFVIENMARRTSITKVGKTNWIVVWKGYDMFFTTLAQKKMSTKAVMEYIIRASVAYGEAKQMKNHKPNPKVKKKST